MRQATGFTKRIKRLSLKGIPIGIRAILRQRIGQRSLGMPSSLKSDLVLSDESALIHLTDIALNLQELLEDDMNVTSSQMLAKLKQFAFTMKDDRLNNAVNAIEQARTQLNVGLQEIGAIIPEYDDGEKLNYLSLKGMRDAVRYGLSSYLTETLQYLNAIIRGYGGEGEVMGNGIQGILKSLESLSKKEDVPVTELKTIREFFIAAEDALFDAYKTITRMSQNGDIDLYM